LSSREILETVFSIVLGVALVIHPLVHLLLEVRSRLSSGRQ